eukprot:UN08996
MCYGAARLPYDNNNNNNPMQPLIPSKPWSQIKGSKGPHNCTDYYLILSFDISKFQTVWKKNLGIKMVIIIIIIIIIIIMVLLIMHVYQIHIKLKQY